MRRSSRARCQKAASHGSNCLRPLTAPQMQRARRPPCRRRWQAISPPKRPNIGMPQGVWRGMDRSISAASLIRGAAATGRVTAIGRTSTRRQPARAPPGVFARDLAECLAVQWRDRDRLDPAMQTLLDNLPLLAARNIGALVRLCGVDAADLAAMIAEIKFLDPQRGL